MYKRGINLLGPIFLRREYLQAIIKQLNTNMYDYLSKGCNSKVHIVFTFWLVGVLYVPAVLVN